MRWHWLLSLLGVGVAFIGGVSFLWAQAQPGGTPPAAPAEPAKPAKAQALINVTVPANATVWIEEQKMTQTGTLRSYQSPPLEPGKTYYYNFKVSWPVAGQPDYTTLRQVTIQAGQTTSVDLTQAAPVYTTPPRIFIRPEGSGYR